MALTLLYPVRPVLSPNWRSSDHPIRLKSSLSFTSLYHSRNPRLLLCRRKFGGFHANLRFHVLALESGGADFGPNDAAADAELQARGESSTPERFRYLYKEAPERSVRWPWAIAVFFFVYAWRTVLWELSNWKKAALAVLSAFKWLMKLLLAFVFRYIGPLITGLIRCTEIVLYSIRHVYASTVAFAPVPELTRIILLTSTILAIAEAAVPDSVNSQPYLLTLAGIIGFGAIRGLVPELLFWLVLSGMFFYSKFIKKRDSVSATLPSAALLVAIGEPWVRGIVMTSYLAISIAHYAKYSKDGGGMENRVTDRKLPLPLLLASLAIGINLAARWIRHRHLTWMIV